MKSLIALAIIACSIVPGIAQPVAASSAGVEELMNSVLAALEAKDQSALQKLAITEDGYHKYVWPSVSANGASVSEKKSYTLFQQGSVAAISSALKDFGGQKMDLLKVSMGATIKQAKGYRLLASPTVTVKNSAGQERTLHLTGAIVEHDGAYQVATYTAPAGQQTASQRDSAAPLAARPGQ